MIEFNTSFTNSALEPVPDTYAVTFYDRRTPIMHDDELDLPILVNEFKALPPFKVKLDVLQRMYKQAGKLVYDYNPFHNLILAQPRELITINGNEYYFREGDLYDFDVDQSLIPLNLKNPVNLEIQPSYDGSVNLIVYDNLNNALLVNSRFSVDELDTYRVIDRRGQNDTNLYEERYLASQIKLYKTSNVISQFELVGVESGGRMAQGSYVFYFKYADQDGNETDVMAESGIVHCFVGHPSNPRTIRGGILNEQTDKLIKLKIKNVDKAYDYINIYYVRNTSDYSETNTSVQYRVLDKYILNQENNEIILTISGYEATKEVSLEEIVQEYNTVDRQKTMAQIQNRLFQANITIDRNDYRDLEDVALRFLPTVRSKHNIGNLNHLYENSTTNPGLEYYDPNNLYSKLGYWNKEIYRLGIVYISKNKLSPVFNIRGGQNISETDLDNISIDYKQTVIKAGNSDPSYTYFPLTKDGERLYVTVTENKEVINSVDNTGNRANENAAGIINIKHNLGPIRTNGVFPLAIQLSVDIETLEYLSSLGIDGFFFVRQKRIPNILFQGLTQGYSTQQEIPVLFTNQNGAFQHRTEILNVTQPIGREIQTSATNSEGSPIGSWESGTTLNLLSNQEDAFSKRFISVGDPETYVPSGTVYSPDLHLNTEQLGDLLVGNDYRLTFCNHQFTRTPLRQDLQEKRHFYNESIQNVGGEEAVKDVKVTLVEEGQPIKFSGSRRFRGIAGTASEQWRFESLSKSGMPEIPSPQKAIRGIYGTYAGLEIANDIESGTYVDVHVPGFAWENLPNYFRVRYNSYQSYHAITDRFDLKAILNQLKSEKKEFWYTEQYRGDCYVGNYTQRINRNFTDPELPLNDTILGNTIVPGALSINTYAVWFSEVPERGIPFVEENYMNINRSDVNQVQLGHWITFKVCSNSNLQCRTIDRRHVDEFATTGSNRSFYPFSKMSVSSEYKIAESTVVNKGNSITTTPKYYLINPDVPYIQDKFTNRIMFSDIHVNDSFRNGYRSFKGLNYKDYNLGHGSITKIFEWNNNLLCVFEHGIGLLPISENTMISGENSGDVYIRGADVLPATMSIISDTYGSQWQDSIIKTARFVYGIDHIAKKIWRTNGQQLELISDFKVQSFLNEGITLNAREKTPVFGIRNIRTHFNAFKEDVMFTYYDVDSVFDEKKWNLCFNEQLNKWVSRYDWEPVTSVSINNIYFSYDRESVEKIALLQSSYEQSTNSQGIVVTEYEIDPSKIIELKLKSDILTKYHPKFYLTWQDSDTDLYDNNLFHLRTSPDPNRPGRLIYKLQPKRLSSMISQNKFLYSLKIKAELYKRVGYEDLYDVIYDVVHLRIVRELYSEQVIDGIQPRRQYDLFYTTRFWKHGQAGIFFSEEKVQPTSWYGRIRPFEFEFIVNDQPAMHKILNNLMIISNNAEPDSITYKVDNDVYTLQKLPQELPYSASDYKVNRLGQIVSGDVDYDIPNNQIVTTVSKETIHLYQKTLNSMSLGRLRGNMHYKEGYWYIDVAPMTVIDKNNQPKQQRIKDKQIRVRVKYSGSKLAVVTSLASIYTQSHA